jgi:hypothetical protein
MMSLLQELFRRSQTGSDISAHLPRLFELASTPHVKVIELGVRRGDSTVAFLAAAEEQAGEVWSVDISEPRVPAEWRDLPFWYVTVGDDLEVSDRLPDQVDIVFIDNGEPMAEYNWLQLPQTTVPNRIHRSSGVTGRVAAYQAAARLSTTPWFFAVFAKLCVDENFDWAWQPDRMQEPKHYIFHACNPINDLVYGHQAAIAYNKKAQKYPKIRKY